MRRRRTELGGRTFARLTVLEFSHANTHSQAIWLCRCDCGATVKVSGQDLISGHTRSCGCLKRELAGVNAKKNCTVHGGSGHALYRVWVGMMQRCYNKNSPAYRNYGGRGIEVCRRWHNPHNFYDDIGDRPRGTAIERIDNNQGYYPSNCKWATSGEQARNRRSNRLLTHNGKTQHISLWASELGIADGTIRDRLDNLGWSVEDALTRPVRRKSHEKKK